LGEIFDGAHEGADRQIQQKLIKILEGVVRVDKEGVSLIGEGGGSLPAEQIRLLVGQHHVAGYAVPEGKDFGEGG
jgi:hypothetical protein